VYLSLYRKYRSQSFEEVSGQDHVTRTLRNALRSGKVAHAYLFCGPRGTGKTSTARLLAKALNCEAPRDGEPCNECDTCRQISEGRYLDMQEIDAASNRGIDDIRDLRDKVAFAPAAGRFKVYVVDEAHQITGEGFNALLKTLEEPPSYVVFILATTEFHKVPATIVSRCQKFDFHRATLEQLRERVQFVAAAEGAVIQPAAVDLIAREANGGWRDALSLLEQVLAFCEGEITARDVYTVLGTVEAETLHEIAEAILAEQGGALYPLIDRLIWDGKDPRQLLRDVTQHFRQLMLTAAGSPPPGEGEQLARLTAQARAFGMQRLLTALEVLAHTEREARWSEEPRLLLEAAVARLMHPRVVTPAVAEAAVPARPPAKSPAPARAPVPTRTPAPTSPFVDEAPRGNEMPPPPLTLGDARTGERDDDDLVEAFTRPAAPSPSPSAPPPAEPARSRPQTAPPPPLEPTGDPDLDVLRGKWRLICEELKRMRKMTIHAVLSGTVPDRMEQDTVVVRFPSHTMAQMFGDRMKEFGPPLVEAIARTTGQKVRVRAESGDAPRSQPRTPPPGQASLLEPPPASPPPASPPPVSPPAASPPPAPATDAAPTGGGRPPAPGPSAPGVGTLGGNELVHNVLDVFEGSIVEDALEVD
jgi:DNA polymerase-3 subunit gamma/tau